jgi:hypothetical protein
MSGASTKTYKTACSSPAVSPCQTPSARQSRAMPSPSPLRPHENTARSQPVFRDVRREGSDGLGIARLPDVVVDVQELDTPDTEQPRAVRVPCPVRERVVFSMDGDPLPAALSRREPEHRPKTHIRDGMQPHGSMREPPVQVHRRRDDGHLSERQGDEQNDPNLM